MTHSKGEMPLLQKNRYNSGAGVGAGAGAGSTGGGPFILRGVTLAGINSVTAPRPIREDAWRRLAVDLDRAKLAAMTSETDLAGALAAGPEILAGRVRGRLVIDVNR